MFFNKKSKNSDLNDNEVYKFKILSTQIIYDSKEDEYYTVATCINDEGKIETINIENFYINNMECIVGANIECNEEYMEGKIF